MGRLHPSRKGVIMPRPEFSSSTAGRSKARNPFTAWAEKRKENKRQTAEKAAKLVTNDTARNETTLVDILGSIDFLHSKLPKSALEAKTRPEQPCGDLEYATKALRQMLLHNPQTITVDIRKLDEKLVTVALLFKQAVEQGDERAAYAAKGALVRGFSNIRARVPANQPELARLFVEANTKYMDSWVTLIGLAQVADRLKQNTEQERALYDADMDKNDKAIAELEERLKNDPAIRQAFIDIKEHDTAEERSRWNDQQRAVHIMLVEQRFSKVKLDLKRMVLTQDERELAAKVGQVETLYAKVAQLPIVADPNLMNKYQEQIDQLFLEMAQSDQEVDETLRLMDDIEGRVEQFNQAPGAVRAREVAAEEAAAALEEIRRRQLQRSGVLDEKGGAGLRELGLYSEAELQQMRQQQEAEEAEVAAEILESVQDEGEVLYN